MMTNLLQGTLKDTVLIHICPHPLLEVCFIFSYPCMDDGFRVLKLFSASEGFRNSTGGVASTPLRQDANNSSSSITSASPSGVNRRTAVLFTRKAASVRKPDTPENQTNM